MKKKLVTLLTIISSFAYSQNTNQMITDVYGRKIQVNSEDKKTIKAKVNSKTSAVYNGVRAITELNHTTEADAYPWLSNDALRIYFTRSGLGSNNQLMYADRLNTASTFNPPVVVPLNITKLTSVWLSPDELNIYICSGSTLLYANRTSTSSNFISPITITLSGSPYSTRFIAGASLNSTQNELFVSQVDSRNFLKVIKYSRTSSTSFAFVREVISNVNASNNSITGNLSKDDLTYYFSFMSNNGTEAILYEIKRPTVNDTFNLNSIQPIQGINDTSAFVYNGQASMSDSCDWVAFVRNYPNSTQSGTWQNNDLYLGHNGVITSVFNQRDLTEQVSIFPNPTKGNVTIQLPLNITEIRITDVNGRLIRTQKTSLQKINLEVEEEGLYFITIETKNESITSKFIVKH